MLITSLASWCATDALRRYGLAHGVLDVPNDRSSHSVPTPRGGGLAIVVVFVITLILLEATQIIHRGFFISILGSSIAIAAIGIWDDHKGVKPFMRLLVHFCAAIWIIFWNGYVTELAFGTYQLYLGWFGAVLTVLALVWLLNLYNFMDGIDGLASIETITVAIGAAVLLYGNGDVSSAIVLMFLAFATGGFLLWNWHPAKIFLGDVGSGFLGICIGALCVHTSNQGSLSVWIWIILLAVFLVDATVTLIRRLLHRQRVYQAHRDHAYQHAARACGSHATVTVSVLLINVLWLWPLAYIANLHQSLAMPLCVLALVPLVWISLHWRAGLGQGG